MICAMQNITVCRSHLTICMPEAGMEKNSPLWWIWFWNGKTFCWPTGISKPITAAVRRERTMWPSGTSERYTPRRLSAEYSSLLQEVNMATGQNRSDAKIFQSQTDQRAHWGFHVLGTGWFSNVSSRSWNQSVRHNSARTVSGFVRKEALRMRLLQPMYVCSVQNSTMS